MQFKSMIAGGFILLASHLSAQNNFPVSKAFQKLSDERTPQLMQTLQHLYRNMPQAAAVSARGGAPKLDSTVLYTGYSLGNDTFPQEKVAFSYPSTNVTVATEFVHLNEWRPGSRTTQTKDNLDRLVEIQAERFDSDTESWVPDSRVYSYPHGNSPVDIDSMVVESFDAESGVWTIVFSISNSFDNQNRLAATLTYADFGGVAFALLDEFYYDANGDNHLTEQSVFEDGAWSMYNRIESEFAQHRAVRHTTSAVASPGMYVPTDMEEITYNGAGNPALEQSFAFDFFTNKWVLIRQTERGFDNQNRVSFIQMEDYTPNGAQPSRTDFEYLDGDFVAVEVYSEREPTTQTWIVLEKLFYYYSGTTSSRDVVLGEQLILWPNPTTGIVHVPVTADARVHILNARGMSVPVTLTNRNSGQIDLTNLPAGLYYITIQDGLVQRVGKVVKQ